MAHLHRRLIGTFLSAVLIAGSGDWQRTACGQGDTNEAAEEEAVENPLTGLFQQIFGAADDGDLREELVEDEEGEFRDNVDARASSDPQLTKKLELATRWIEQEDWNSAIATLQPLLIDHQDTLYRDDTGWKSLQTEVESRIGRMPDDGLQAYRSAWNGLAAELLHSGGGLSDYTACAEVASRYFHTVSGYRAAEALALHHLDSGQFTQSAYWFSRLLNAPASMLDTETASWRLAAAYAFHRAGHQERAEELLESVPSASASTETIRELIRESRIDDPAAVAQVDDWLMLYGSADHRGLAEEERPLLLKRWSVPLTARHAILSQVDDLLLDLADNHRPPIPAWQPVLVNGKAAFRTMRGVAAVDVSTGNLLWESSGRVSAERLLSSETDGGNNYPRPGIARIARYGMNQQDHHQLATLLFRDAVYGLLSSDGRMLFSIEQQALMTPSGYNYWWNRNRPSDQDAFRRDWSTNRLVAFDLDSGRPVWEIGGRRMGEPFDPPLAGTYLFGPPVPAADELFLMGERDDEIHLIVLKSSTGELLWSLPLASASTEIEFDAARRNWAAQPALDAGLVVCPTTVGWLVAVDWRQRRIRWAYRYAARTESARTHRGMVFNSQQQLGTRWYQSAPILAGGRVLYTPSEQPDETGIDQPRLICLDALTGTLHWERPKEAGLYVAGVVGETVVIVQRDSVVGVSLSDGGRELWSAELPAGALPAGRGVLSAERLLLPLDSGELVTIDVSGGKVLARQSSPDAGPRPGNLAIHAGTMVSLSPHGIDAFELRDSVEAEIARRRQQDPEDAWATLREAEIFQTTGDYRRALERLDLAATQLHESDAELRDRHRRRTFDCLLKLCREDPAGRAREFERLGTVAETDLERFAVERLDARRRLVAQDLEGAFSVYWQLIDSPGPPFVRTGDVNCRIDLWLSGRMEEAWSAADGAARIRLDGRIHQVIDDALAGDLAGQLRWERLLRFHPDGWRLTWALIEQAAEQGDFAGAEVRLRRLVTSDDSVIAASALKRLGELLLEFGQPADAATSFARMERDLAEAVLIDGRSAAEHAAEQFEDSRLSRELLAPRPVGIWSTLDFEIENRRVQSGQTLTQPVALTDDGAEFFRWHRLEYEPNTQQLIISPAESTIPSWSTPLRMASQPWSQNQPTAVAAYGLQAVVLHRGVLHGLSLPDRNVRWTQQLDESGSTYNRQVVLQSVAPMQTRSRFLASSSLSRRGVQHGMLAHACAEYIAQFGRGEVKVLDPLTGELLWACSGLAPRTTLFGDDGAVYLTMGDGSLRVLRATDGSELDRPGLSQLLGSAVAWRPHSLILLQRDAGSEERPERLTVKSVDRQTLRTEWSLDFDRGAQLSLIDDNYLLVLETTGDCHLVDFAMAESVELGVLPREIMEAASQVHVVTDSEYVYFLVDHLPNQSWSYVNAPLVRVNGTVFAMRREGGGLVWQHEVASQNLLLTQFEHSPLMVFLSYQSQMEPDLRFSYFHVRVAALDKQTGRVVAELEQPMPGAGGFYQMRLDMAGRAFDIRSHNQRLTIRAVDSRDTGDQRE